jgi:alkylhydroperoxidase/carboxymuconolactone decarboxylase family protein YurZ
MATRAQTTRTSKPGKAKASPKTPGSYQRFGIEQPTILARYEALGLACAQAGPLDTRTIALCKLALSFGAGLEGAAHSHCRKALEAGCTADELMHGAILGAPTIGFPSMMRNRGWVEDVVKARASRSTKK